MKDWFIRLLVFSLLWFFYLYENIIAGASYSLLLVICAFAFALYFFLPVIKNPLWLLITLQALFLSLVFLGSSLIWIWILLLYIMIEAAWLLPMFIYRMYLASGFGSLIFINAVKMEWTLISLIPSIFVLFSFVLLNQYIWERQEQKDLYEQLLGEYRNLKRVNIENERVARLEERTRIAHDIHDSVGHKLTALLMQLEMLSMEKKSVTYIEELKELARESLEETRQAVKTLKHEEVAGIAFVLQLIRKLESENHLLVRFTTKQGVLLTRLTNDQSIVLYRAVQEALTNTMKHGYSREVAVTLGRSAIGDVEWIISNPILQPCPFEIGFGLTAMRERVEALGGKLRIYQTEHEFIIEGSLSVEGNMQ